MKSILRTAGWVLQFFGAFGVLSALGLLVTAMMPPYTGAVLRGLGFSVLVIGFWAAAFALGGRLRGWSEDATAGYGSFVCALAVSGALLAALAFAAMGQFYRTMERARSTEARRFLQLVSEAQKARLEAKGGYARTKEELLAGNPALVEASRGLRAFEFTAVEKGGAEGCPPGEKPYRATLTRGPDVSARWSRYRVIHESCSGISFPGCEACAQDRF